jgi:hypothetical protein
MESYTCSTFHRSSRRISIATWRFQRQFLSSGEGTTAHAVVLSINMKGEPHLPLFYQLYRSLRAPMTYGQPFVGTVSCDRVFAIYKNTRLNQFSMLFFYEPEGFRTQFIASARPRPRTWRPGLESGRYPGS